MSHLNWYLAVDNADCLTAVTDSELRIIGVNFIANNIDQVTLVEIGF